MELVGPDSLKTEATVSVYAAAQDADGDGFPDEGQEPVACLAFAGMAKRVKVMPQCVPPPMPGQ